MEDNSSWSLISHKHIYSYNWKRSHINTWILTHTEVFTNLHVCLSEWPQPQQCSKRQWTKFFRTFLRWYATLMISWSQEQQTTNTCKTLLKFWSVCHDTVWLYRGSFMQSSEEFLGHLVDADGLHLSADKLRAFLQAPTSQSVQELCSFLGLINYFSKFVNNLSTLLFPLNKLLQKDNSGVSLLSASRHSILLKQNWHPLLYWHIATQNFHYMLQQILQPWDLVLCYLTWCQIELSNWSLSLPEP